MSNSPSTYWSARPTLDKLGAAGMLVEVGCYGCRKKRTYLAADLAEYFGGHKVVGEVFPGCPYCNTGANWWERYRYAGSDDVLNRVMIRKFKGWRQIAVWANEPYEAPAPKEAPPPGLVPWRGL